MAIDPKYRRLTPEELNALEKEFIEFLILNGIAADDWQKMKNEDQEKAEDIITLFSDVVFHGVLRKIHFLEFRGQKEVRTFQCLTEKMVLVGMEYSGSEAVDFNDNGFLKRATTNPPMGVRIYTTDKKYQKPRETELFEMLQAGCEITNGRLFKALSMALA